jgi:hypothetical protein
METQRDFERSKWKAAKLSSNLAEKENSKRVFQSYTASTDFHRIEDGTNTFRLLPPHSPEDPSWVMKAVYWLPALKDERNEQGELTGTTVRGRYPIFDSRIHGGTRQDLVDEFIKLARGFAYKKAPKEEAKQLLYPITGYRDKRGTWNPGISVSRSFIAYATKGEIKPENIGLLEVYQADHDKLEELNFLIGDTAGEPITVDLLSDPDEGVCFKIIRQFNKEANKWDRIVKRDEFIPPRGLRGEALGRAMEEWQESQKIPDEVLEKLGTMKPLREIFVNAYKYRDFQRALEALKYFDEETLKLGVFESEEFQEIVKSVDAQYEHEPFPEEVKLKENVRKEPPKKTKVIVPEVAEELPEEAPQLSARERVLQKMKKNEDLVSEGPDDLPF